MQKKNHLLRLEKDVIKYLTTLIGTMCCNIRRRKPWIFKSLLAGARCRQLHWICSPCLLALIGSRKRCGKSGLVWPDNERHKW